MEIDNSHSFNGIGKYRDVNRSYRFAECLFSTQVADIFGKNFIRPLCSSRIRFIRSCAHHSRLNSVNDSCPNGNCSVFYDIAGDGILPMAGKTFSQTEREILIHSITSRVKDSKASSLFDTDESIILLLLSVVL